MTTSTRVAWRIIEMAKANGVGTRERITINCFTKINSNDIRIGRKIAGANEKK